MRGGLLGSALMVTGEGEGGEDWEMLRCGMLGGAMGGASEWFRPGLFHC